MQAHLEEKQGGPYLCRHVKESSEEAGAHHLLHIEGEQILPHTHQVGGHRAKSADEPPYLLRFAPNHLLKIIQSGDKGERELEFYQTLFPSSSSAAGCCPSVSEEEEQEEIAPAPPATISTIDQQAKGLGYGLKGLEDHPQMIALRSFVPAFYGVKMVNDSRYLILEDMCETCIHSQTTVSSSRRRRRKGSTATTTTSSSDGSRGKERAKVSVLDLKMGRVTHGMPWATPEKVAREKAKYAHQQSIGFRIIGMKIYNPCAGEYELEGKAYGRSLGPDDVVDALGRFFLRKRSEGDGDGDGAGSSVPKIGRDNEGTRRRQLRRRGRFSPSSSQRLGYIIIRLEAMRGWFQEQKLLRFWSSSLLFVDTDIPEEKEDSDEKGKGEEWEAEDNDKEEEKEGNVVGVDVRMIDFAHVEVRGAGTLHLHYHGQQQHEQQQQQSPLPRGEEKPEIGNGHDHHQQHRHNATMGETEDHSPYPVASEGQGDEEEAVRWAKGDENYMYALDSILQVLRTLKARGEKMEAAAAAAGGPEEGEDVGI